MRKEGYVESVVIDNGLDSAIIAMSCHMPEGEYKSELDAAIASILHFSNERHREAEITLLAEKGEDPFDIEDGCTFQLTAKIDESGRRLIFELLDLAKPDEKRYIEMKFKEIKTGLAPYREHVETVRLSGKSKDDIQFIDTARVDIHERVIRQIGLDPRDLEISAGVIFHDHMAKYLVTLVIALFPQGPQTDWRLVPALPVSVAAKLSGFESK